MARRLLGVVLALAALMSGCGATASHPPAGDRPLRQLAPSGFHIGTAVAGSTKNPALADERYTALLAAQFNSLTPENQMKWRVIEPSRGRFEFGPADEVAAFARAHRQRLRGHTFIWHGGAPDWIADSTMSCDELRPLVKEHIQTVVKRYADVVYAWDVANEVIDDHADLRTKDNAFVRICGKGIIADAFRWAHEADPDATLFLNDYRVEPLNQKSDAYYALAKELLADGVPLGGFGVQAHLVVGEPYDESVRANLQRFADLGLAVAVTEADVRMRLVAGEAPYDDLQEQARVYGRLLDACLSVTACDSFTVWGFTDAYSWVPSARPGEGAAHLFDAEYAPKAGYAAVAERLAQGR